MRLAGNLNTTPIGDVLHPVADARRTGVLHIERSPVLTKIVFREGRIFSSWSNDPRESLAKFLVRDGRVTEDQLFQAQLRQGEEGRLIGSILVSVGLMSEEHLQAVLRTKIEETIYDLFLWPEARFEFRDGEFPTDVHIHVEMEVAEVLLEGARRIHEWVRVRKFLPSLLRTTFHVLGEASRDPSERRAMSLAAAGKSLAEISVEMHLTEFETATRFVDLMSRGVVGVGPAAGERPGAVSLREVPELLARGYQKLQAGHHDEAVQIYESILTLDRLNFHAKKGVQSALEARRQERLRQAQADSGAPMPELSPNEATLVVTGGPWHGTVLSMREPPSQTLLGSGFDCQLRLEAPGVDRYHARIAGYARGFILSDAGSAAGTFANGRRVDASHTLADGDEVTLGPPDSPASTRIVVRLPARYRMAGPASARVLDASPRLDPPLAAASPGAGAAFGVATDAPRTPPMGTPRPDPVAASSIEPAHDAAGHHPQRAAAAVPAAAPVVQLPPAARAVAGRSSIGRQIAFAAVVLLGSGGALAAYRGLLRSGPELTSLEPTRARPGERVTLRGRGFEAEPGRNRVLFGDQGALVDSASERELIVIVPETLYAADGSALAVTVGSPRGSSKSLSFTLSRVPRVESLAPDVGLPGDVVEVRGRDLDRAPAVVHIADVPARIQSVGPAALRVVVPELPAEREQSVPVRVAFGADAPQTLSLVLGRLPLITGIAPKRGPAGERVIVSGRGFDPNPLGNLVTFNGQPALVLTAEPTALAVAAPALPQGGSAVDAQLVVQVLGRSPSLPAAFTVVRPAGDAFSLRFFPAPEPEHPTHDHALVSTELGPLLLLTGRGDAPTTAERAHRIAASLNAMVEPEAATDGVADAASTAGNASATPDAVAPTPEDADGYAESWGPSTRERRPTVDDVAAYWQALIADYRDVFVRGVRPSRVVELSGRGDVLAEIHGRIPRNREPDSGVPRRAVSPLSPAVARRLRDLALLVPAGAAVRGPAGAVGAWEGTITEPGTGVQALRLHLSLAGDGLSGSATLRASGATAEFPLDGVRYERGTLRFALGGGGPAYEFSGSVRGESMTGTIRVQAPRRVVGRFALRLVESAAGTAAR